ncbi:hydroxyethylthiazole kinase [Desulfovibrio sp. OttesenSCG-928-C06]|nr:hydroxyethylthiazole kinase [Desulfovibrio sp. OttesenSCG-928-C06]
MPSPVPFQPAQAVPFINALRSRKPVVHCITNDVVQAFTANALLAVGAVPAMIVAEEEAGEFAAMADAMLANIGTIHRNTAQSMLLATAAAHKNQKPWVLDPVAVGLLAYRAGVADQLLQNHPAAIRGNASEILALAGQSSSAKGPDSLDETSSAHDAADELAIRYQTIVALTGEVDFITNGRESLSVHGGHVNLTRITGAGCALSGIVAAFLGCNNTDRLGAVAAACQMMKTAGQDASRHAGLGSFAVALMDSLSLQG